MDDQVMPRLEGSRLLVVEDEYLIAADLKDSLESLGAEVVGPAASVEEALRLIETSGDKLDGAVLDVNLRGERVFPVADALGARGVPFIFASGYDAVALPKAYDNVARVEKPVDKRRLLQVLSRAPHPGISA
jgi:CheY-like chemotaxis protein